VGLFRRGLSDSVLERIAQRELGAGGKIDPSSTHKDVFVLRAGRDGKINETCWFCGGEISADVRDPASGVAMLMIEGLGGGGEAIHGVCHSTCAERAKGSLSPDGF